MNPTELGSQHQPATSRGSSCARNQRSPARAPEGGRRENGERSVQGLDSRRPCSPDREWEREGEGTEPGTPGACSRRTEVGVPVSLTTAPGHSPSYGTGEGRERRDPPRGGGGGRGHLPGSGTAARLPGPCPAADRAYRVSPFQVTLLVAKGRDVDLHGCASRPAEGQEGRAPSRGRRSAPGRAAPPSFPAPAGPGGSAAQSWVCG